MQSRAATVDDYLASLPDDRRAIIDAVRKVILKNLDKDYAEGMQYGMIGYYVPHSVFPAGYHCDPKQPLPFAGLASQKGHLSLYIMGLYGHQPSREWFERAWKATGRKLDMGKACIRFKKLEDVALDVVGEAFRRFTAKNYIAHYQAALGAPRTGPAKPSSKPKRAAPAKPTAPKKSSTRKASKKSPAQPKKR